MKPTINEILEQVAEATETPIKYISYDKSRCNQNTGTQARRIACFIMFVEEYTEVQIFRTLNIKHGAFRQILTLFYRFAKTPGTLEYRISKGYQAKAEIDATRRKQEAIDFVDKDSDLSRQMLLPSSVYGFPGYGAREQDLITRYFKAYSWNNKINP